MKCFAKNNYSIYICIERERERGFTLVYLIPYIIPI